ncbi:phage major capsid protein [Cryobacterium zongtaii]|uniref:Phage major capsid protein n=1 Tax=Cryobacterium zongtaii TaxID=1259217 RepID=A0A2S3ZCW8_9MICO|nr:phage major capsid protein [Cryobacterium zongtaii]POH63952.1 phage major capsid protein [Cryobacterium zongtaii]
MNLKEKRAAALKAAQAIIDGSKALGRDLNAEESAAVEGHVTEVKALDIQIAAAAKSADLIESIGGLAPEQDIPAASGAAKSLGEHFIKSAGDRIKSIGERGVTIVAPEFKANTDTQVSPALSTASTLNIAQVDQTVISLRKAPVIADLLGTGTISGSAITYFVEGAREGNITAVAEGGQKPQIHYAEPVAVTDSLAKIAGWWDVTDEMLEDLGFLVSEINRRAVYDLVKVEEQQLLNGNGTAPNLRGLLQRSGLQLEVAANRTDNADALYRAIAKVDIGSDLAADGLVIHPSDYQTLRLGKDSNGQYYGGGYFGGTYGNGGLEWQPPVWGLRTVVTSAIAAGTSLVGNYAQAATLYRKGGVTVESTNSDGNKFTTNKTTFRVEERVALAVRKPAAFVKVTFSAAAPA